MVGFFSEFRIFRGLNFIQLSSVHWNSRNVDVCCEWKESPEKAMLLEGRAVCKSFQTFSEKTFFGLARKIEQGSSLPPGGRRELLSDSTYHSPSWVLLGTGGWHILVGANGRALSAEARARVGRSLRGLWY